jgi:CPA2 family monovalent cation:H+ antiporter-2
MDVLTAVIVGTMILGAMMVPLADRLSRFAERLLARRQSRRREPPGPSSAPEDVQVVIVGYGLNGKNLGRVLRETGMPSCVVEMNPTLAAEARGADERVLVGDATRWVILQRAGLAHARALVIAINDPDATRRIVAQAHAARPDLFILARTRTIAEVDVLHRLGAREVIPEEFETSIEIFTHVLHEFRVPTNVIEAQIALIRSGRYGMLRGVPGSSDQRKELLQYLDATATQTFLLPAESPVCGRTIRDTELRARTGTTIIAVVRNGKPTTNPTPDLRLEAGDVLVLVGAHGQLDNAKSLLTPPSGQSPATPALPQQAG